MKTTILTISIALASALSALAQTVMRENSTVYFKTNVFLHDDPTNPLHQRISVEGKEPLWVAASNQVAYYQSSEMTNASIHARYLYSTNATLLHANIHATALNAQNIQLGVNKYYEEPYPECIAMFDGGVSRYIFAPSRDMADLRQNIPIDPYFFPIWLGGIKGDGIVSSNGTLAVESNLVVGGTNVVSLAGQIATNVVGAATNALLDRAGTRAMTGPLNMNTNAITKVSYVTGHTGKGLFFDDNSLDFWDSSAIFNDGGTNVWQGRVNDTEASRIAALPVSPVTFNSTSWLQSDGTNLFFVSTVPPGFTNALTTNTP